MAQICDEIISMGADHQAFISAASRLKVDEVIGRRSEYDVIVIGPCLAPDFRFYLLLRRVTKGYIL
jgi:hypothetical protein